MLSAVTQLQRYESTIGILTGVDRGHELQAVGRGANSDKKWVDQRAIRRLGNHADRGGAEGLWYAENLHRRARHRPVCRQAQIALHRLAPWRGQCLGEYRSLIAI